MRPSVDRSARFAALTRLMKSALSEKNHAHFIAARPNDLLAALNVMLLFTIALSGSARPGRYCTDQAMPSASAASW